MRSIRSAAYIAWALYELLRHDLVAVFAGFQGIHRRLLRTGIRRSPAAPAVQVAICRAMDGAVAVYPKRVMCLQRSMVTVSLLRKSGVGASLVVGYRPAPFFSHAWVEVGDRVVDDQPAYRQRLKILFRA